MGEYLQEAVLPVQYDNYVFDLYGTLVDIHTEEDFPKLWESLALPFERRRARTLRPFFVDILLRNPCSFERWRFFG